MLLSYLIGSIPFGVVIGKFKHIDPRNEGSKNIGSTNVLRTMGPKYAALCMMLDGFKGFIIIFLIKWIFELDIVSFIGKIDILPVYGLLSILGHTNSIFLKFKGGKAVATSAGVIAALSPIVGVSMMVVYLIIFFISGLSSLGSLISTTLAVVAGILEIIIFKEIKLLENSLYIAFYLIVFGIILYKHVNNIRKLARNQETRFNVGLQKKLNEDKKSENNINNTITIETVIDDKEHQL
jgi:glycerol-3-phosphate acyltransferase PlsY